VAKKSPIEYSDSGDEIPCVVAKKTCGCYVAACAVDECMMEEIREILNEEDGYLSVNSLKKSSLLEMIIDANAYGATLEVRPVAFVRQGGLTFGCKHPAKETVEVG
jgi:hypothetical protein